MRRLLSVLLGATLAALALSPAAQASFGFANLGVEFTEADDSPALQAGSHPFAMKSTFEVNVDPLSGAPEGSVKDLEVDLPPGFVADPMAVPRCSTADFLTLHDSGSAKNLPSCPNATALGFLAVLSPGETVPVDLGAAYNLAPPPGAAFKFGFRVLSAFVTVQGSIRSDAPHNAFASLSNIAQIEPFAGSELTVWGTPADSAHDTQRGDCLFPPAGDKCSVDVPVRPFITLPRSCAGTLATIFKARSWQDPATWVSGEATTPGMIGCEKLSFAPHIEAKPTTDNAESPSGLDFNLDISDEGLANPGGIAQSDIRKAVVTLPAGVTLNPSIAAGLATCSKAELEAETIAAAGCPDASKVGTVEVETPLLEGKLLKGQLFVATQDDPGTPQPGAENPFDSMIALYMVIKNPELGILVKLAGKVEPNEEQGPNAGRIITTFDDIPQFPFSHFRFHFREGARSPLITPAQCGTYTTEAVFTPGANPASPLTTTASFQITHGVGGSACPPPGPLPFKPGFEAGTINNSAGSYSPTFMRLTRKDAEQDMTKFSTTLPPGLTAKIAGLSRCPDAQIAAARAKTGRQELAAPSCPASSEIGRVLGGAGVGSQLTYVGGHLYIAGPYNGDPLSVVAIVPAVAGPFDAGTVVVRVALTLDPVSAQAEVDGSASDPFPHILKGIVLKVRDIRVYADRPAFTLNPTSCDRFQFAAKIFGSALDVFNPADDAPVSLAAPFQAANCASLGFKPKLTISLKGGTKRGGHPALRAIVTPRSGDANFGQAVVTLPRSAFLDQGHIRTICTRVQFAAKNCPAGAVYGFAKATSPLLDEPAQGPVYLRSSNHNLPDLVMALKGPPSAAVEVDLIGRIDSHKGGIRASFETIPDLPVTKFVLNMQGGKKGLIINSRNLCANDSRASARLIGQNGRRHDFEPLVKPQGCKGKSAKRSSARR